jgi:glycosyltransferase involved in cell wall biosynthesis
LVAHAWWPVACAAGVRVLLIAQHFTPERTAAPLRLLPLARGLARCGHAVEVVCAVPNHPEGVIHDGYRGSALVRRRFDGLAVSYVWVKATRSKDPRRRLLTFATFAASATLVGLFSARPSVIFASSPPLTAGAVGALLARRFRVPWVLDVRDLWVDAAGSLGVVRSGKVVRLASRLERWLYANAAAITVPTDAFGHHIGSGVEGNKVHLLPNGASEPWLSVGSQEVNRHPLGLPDDRFVWTFAGNLGLSQGLDAAIAAAGRLGAGFQLLLLGDGASRPRLETAARKLPPGSVAFRDPVDPEQAALYMRSSDALLVSLSKDPVAAKTVPAKLYDSCPFPRPVVVAAPGEAQRLAESEGIAIAVPPEDPEALADAVRTLRDRPGLGDQLADAGRRFAFANPREAHVGSLERLLLSLAK